MDVNLTHRTLGIPTIRNATRTWTRRETLRLRLSCPRSRVTGYGEASPLPGFSLDTIDDVARWFHGVDLTRLSFHDAPDVSHLLLAASQGASPVPPSARFCLESVLLTGFCAARRIPVERALATLTAPSEQSWTDSPPAPVESAPLLDVLGEAPEARAVELSTAGSRVFKIKIGRDVDAEVGKLHAVVEALHSIQRPVLLRLDANQSLSPSRVRELARDCKDLPIEYIEEPCPTAVLTTHELREGLGLPLAFDESLAAGADVVLPWLDSGHVRALVCKPMYLGGILVTREWVSMAHARGIDVVMSHLFDGPWAMRLYEAMARAFAPGVVAGLAPHAALPVWQRDLDES